MMENIKGMAFWGDVNLARNTQEVDVSFNYFRRQWKIFMPLAHCHQKIANCHKNVCGYSTWSSAHIFLPSLPIYPVFLSLSRPYSPSITLNQVRAYSLRPKSRFEPQKLAQKRLYWGLNESVRMCVKGGIPLPVRGDMWGYVLFQFGEIRIEMYCPELYLLLMRWEWAPFLDNVQFIRWIKSFQTKMWQVDWSGILPFENLDPNGFLFWVCEFEKKSLAHTRNTFSVSGFDIATSRGRTFCNAIWITRIWINVEKLDESFVQSPFKTTKKTKLPIWRANNAQSYFGEWRSEK